ncbi:MAG: arylsulfatase [Gammaproteobacteria bacterium]|nr:arylsulfatase [Gammaproteobacteria bacterium]
MHIRIKILLTSIVLIYSLILQAADRPPNFVIIIADDLGYGDVGAYGSTLIRTPHLDRMAQEGVLLTNFYSSANVCTAARGGLMTGRYPIRLALVNDVARPGNEIHIAAEETTIAEALQGQGYRTALFGKWHLGSRLEWSPLNNGFDEYFGLLHSNDMAPLQLYRGDQVIEDPVDQSTLTERYTEEAVRFIGENRERPFLLYIPHTFPHVPLHVSNRFSGQSDAGIYGDTVETIDWSVGEVLAALKTNGLDENTLVVFTSDNGPWFEGSAGPFRDRKGSSWEGGLRVPFIARWPSVLPAGQKSDEPAMNIDLFPTLVGIAGGELPADRVIDGKDMLPLLRDGANSSHEALYLFDGDRITAVRAGQWKLVVESRYRAAVSRFDHPASYYSPNGLLFDLLKDPSETYSYTREMPEVAARLHSLLVAGQQQFNSAVLPQMFNR